jgi:enediyne biosynthesis protein E4
MNRIFKQALIGLFFAGQLVTVWALNRAGTEKPEEPLAPELALQRYGFYLRDHAKEAGLNFTHGSPRDLDKDLKHILPIVASMGASVSVVDFDRDGNLDVYVVTSREGGKNKLFRNLGNGKFRDVAEEMGVADLNRPEDGCCMGAVWGDFDNDGYEDLLVYRWGRVDLYRNDGGKRFVRVSEKAGMPKHVNANSAVWLDYDCDGHLDLFIAGYWPDGVDLWNLKTTKMMPESFEFAKNGGRKYLLRNKGDGTFEDVTEKMGITSTRWTLGVQAADLCGSGYPDIILANDYGVSEFLCNRNGERFEELGDQTEIGKKPKSGMNVTFGDVFNRGKFCLYVTNISEPGILVQGNWLWVPQHHKPGEPPRYVDEALQRRVQLGGWSWGAQFGDLNNDGRLDLFLTNGYVSANKKRSYWYDYGLIAGGNAAIISDAKNWPAIGDRSLSGYQKKHLWFNGGGSLVEAAVPIGVTDRYDGRSVAMADLFNRGVLDVLVANQNGPLLLHKNTVAEGRDWVQFDLEGTKANRSAIGALVRVFWKMKGAERTQEQVQVVSGGNGYASQNMRRLHFGLGEEAKVEKVIIEWPGGAKETLNDVALNKLHKIREGGR